MGGESSTGACGRKHPPAELIYLEQAAKAEWLADAAIPALQGFSVGVAGTVLFGVAGGRSGTEFLAGSLAGDAPETAATIFSVAALLTAQAESQMRHCATV